APERVHASVVQRKNLRRISVDFYQVHVAAELESVPPLDPGQVVGPLEAPLHAIFRGERLAPQETEASQVDRRCASTRQIGESVVQPTPRVLETRLVEKVVAKRCRMLRHYGQVAGLLVGGAIPGILPEVLVLRINLNSRDKGRRNAGPKERGIRIVPNVVQLQRPQARPLLRWIVS